MYKIYINGNCLLIADHSSVLSGANDHIKTVPFLGNHKSLLNYIDKLEKSQEQLSIALLTPDPAQLFMMAKSLYKSIKA
ncbi:MAG: hypothetical protein HKN76_09650, partial [Saprospiraceae bacterium]|nr:hypothetical protein [Saprospiraceae bacterium]